MSRSDSHPDTLSGIRFFWQGAFGSGFDYSGSNSADGLYAIYCIEDQSLGDMNSFASNRIFLALLAIGGILGALVMGSWVAKGNFFQIALILGGIFGALIFLTLGRMYWYVIPFALAAQLPALPMGGRDIDSGELAVVACTCLFIVRLAMKKDHLALFRFTNLPILLFMTWVMVVWSQSPVGISLLGSSTLGGRHYFKLLVAFCAFIILGSQEVTEKDFLRIMLLVVFGAILKAGYGLFSHFFGGGGDAEALSSGYGEYTWHQILNHPAVICSALIFSRYKPSEVFGFQRPWAICLYFVCLGLALFSGKRTGMMFVMITPFISAMVYREFRQAAVLSTLGAVSLFILVTGHGSLFELPFTAQRALSWLPGNWDTSLDNLQGGSDKFREEMRRLAIKEIDQHPWIGKGYAMEYNEIVASSNLVSFGRTFEDQMIFYAVGRSWHNRWLGYAADFGIPASVLLVFIYGTGLFTSYRLVRILPHPSSRQVFAIFAFMWIFRSVATSHTSGHTALDALSDWWLYGLLFALYAVTTRHNTTTLDTKTPTPSLGSDNQKSLLVSP